MLLLLQLIRLPELMDFSVFVNSKSMKSAGGETLFLLVLEGKARYAGLLLAPAEGFGLQPRFFMLFLLILGNF